MKHNFVIKTLVVGALLLGQSAYAMVQQRSTADVQEGLATAQKALMKRIDALTIQQDGSLSDANLVNDIHTFAGPRGVQYGVPKSPGAALLEKASDPNAPYEEAKKDLDHIQQFLAFIVTQGKDTSKQSPLHTAAETLYVAAIAKIAALKKAREKGLKSKHEYGELD